MKIFKWKINEKIVAAIAIVCFIILCLLPLLMIGKYNHPCADDFGYGYDAHVAWQSTHSVIETVKAAASTVRFMYYAWQGTFTSIFLMALTPMVFGEQYYAIVPFIMLGMLTASVLYLSKVLVCDILKGSKANSIILSVILLFMMIEEIYTPASAFFWYNAAIHYTFMQSVMFFMVAFVLRSATSKKTVISVISCVFATMCAFILSGGNYLNALIGMILLVSLFLLFTILFVWDKKKGKKESPVKSGFRRFYLFLFPLVVYIYGFRISVIAPGNEVRGRSFEDTPALVAILRSFGSGFEFAGEWISLFTIVLLILALPAIWAITDKTKYRFRWPLLVIAFSFCLFCATFTSSHYGMAGPGLPRTFNNCKMLYQLLLMINEVYLIGWLKVRLKESKKERLKKFVLTHGVMFYIIVSVALAGVFLACDDKEAYYPSYASAKYMKQGFAMYYHMQYLERITVMNGPETVVYVKEVAPKLNVLYVDDVTTNPKDWRNEQYARWYGKEQVILIPWEEWHQQ
ncbi:MAG: hypothetical protein IJ397_08955 [Lachnospiraceae bacterium]|nr:hypothetical protein [Lachnospiraceae bacterium]